MSNEDDYGQWKEKLDDRYDSPKLAFYNPDVDPDLLTEDEEFLDDRSICRRGRHDWTIGIAGLDREAFKKAQELPDDRRPVYCRKCKSFGSIKVRIEEEGDFSQQRPAVENIDTHIQDMDEEDVEEVLIWYNGPQMLTFKAGGHLHWAVALKEGRWLIDQVEPYQIEEIKKGKMSPRLLLDDTLKRKAVCIDDGETWELKMLSEVPDEDLPKRNVKPSNMKKEGDEDEG